MAKRAQAKELSDSERAEFRRAVMEYQCTHRINDTIRYPGVSRSFVCKWQKRYKIDPADLHDQSRVS